MYMNESSNSMMTKKKDTIYDTVQLRCSSENGNGLAEMYKLEY